MTRMAMMLSLLAGLVSLGATVSVNEVSQNGMALRAMEQVFTRSERTHEKQMAAIMRSMSIPKAVEVLQKHNLSTPALIQVTNMALGGHSSHLRRQPKGYSGIDGAR